MFGDPLIFLLNRSDTLRPPPEAVLARVRAGLDMLDRHIEQPAGKSPNPISLPSGLPSTDLQRVAVLYLRLFQTSGKGHMLNEQTLLSTLAASGHPSLLQFWLQVLDLSRPKDRDVHER